MQNNNLYSRFSGPVTADFGNQGASTTYARISRADWDDYKKRFIPYEKKLMGIYQNEDMLTDQINRNVGAVDQSYQSTQRGADDLRKLYNSPMTGRQQHAYQRKSNMQNNIAKVNAKNMTRLAKKDRDMQLMAGANNTSSNLRKEYQE